jgi:branched-chain amino acid transport system permease protein
MSIEEEIEVNDKDIIYREYFDKKQSEFLKTLVCEEVIQEHENNSHGQHSEPLSRLLHFFSSAPQKNKYAIKHDKKASSFKIIALSGVRGDPPRIIEDKEFKTIEDAYHGVFLKRISDLMKS